MRGRFFNIPAIGRAAGFALVAAAIVAAALRFHHDDQRERGLPLAPAATSDPLSTELLRCQVLATQAKDDDACEAAWAESRRRFFTYRPAPSAASTPAASPKTSNR